MKLKVGDVVVTTNTWYRGQIAIVHSTCPMNNDWLQNQGIPIPAHAVRSTWYTINVEEGGVVCAPKCFVMKLPNGVIVPPKI